MKDSYEVDKLIEKCWAKNTNKYTMGNPKSLENKKSSKENLEETIAETTTFYQPNLEDSYPDISGLIERLKTSRFNFDIEQFDTTKEKTKKEIYKIIYFFYDLEYNRLPNFLSEIKLDRLGRGKNYFNAVEFLSNPTIESMDLSSFRRDTYNGKIIKFIKYPLEKEIGTAKAKNIQKVLDLVEQGWYNQIFKMRYAVGRGEKIDFSHKIQEIQSVLDNPPQPLGWHIPISPIETLYFRIIQFERIGELKAFLSNNQYVFRTKYNTPSKFLEEMKAFKDMSIFIPDIERFVKKNIDVITKLVYLKDNSTKDERKNIKRNLYKIPQLLEYCKLANPNVIVKNHVSILRVISCLQAILTDEYERFNSRFYLMQKHFSHPQTDNLKPDKHMVDVLKFHWVCRINNHFNANLGEYEVRNELQQYESKIYELICQLFSYPTIPEMLDVNTAFSTVFS